MQTLNNSNQKVNGHLLATNAGKKNKTVAKVNDYVHLQKFRKTGLNSLLKIKPSVSLNFE